jgi:hypothetical protein
VYAFKLLNNKEAIVKQAPQYLTLFAQYVNERPIIKPQTHPQQLGKTTALLLSVSKPMPRKPSRTSFFLSKTLEKQRKSGAITNIRCIGLETDKSGGAF